MVVTTGIEVVLVKRGIYHGIEVDGNFYHNENVLEVCPSTVLLCRETEVVLQAG